LHGHRLSPEEICNEYAAQKLICQGQACLTEKSEKAKFCLEFIENGLEF